jgi:hypothetical protein
MVGRLLVVAVAGVACGRSGYQVHEAVLDGGDADDDGGLSGVDGGTAFDAAGLEDCLIVTLAGDTPGDGLTLREAITLANDAPGADCIQFDPAVTAVSFGDSLPSIDDPDGLFIDGGGDVSLGGGAPTGLTLASGGNTLRGLEITGVDVGVVIEIGSSLLRDVHIHGNSATGIIVEAGAGADLGPCLIHDNGGNGIRAEGSVDLSVRHCTIANNQVSGILATLEASGLIVLNSIVAENGDPGIVVDDQTSVDTIDFSDVAGNQTANCQGCTLGAGCTTQSPDFTDPAVEDYTLQAGSPAIDTGTDLGFDRNGAGAGDFNGTGPDMGYYETPAL